MAFIVISLLVLYVFAYQYMIDDYGNDVDKDNSTVTNGDSNSDSDSGCHFKVTCNLKLVIISLFDFSPPGDAPISLIEIMFGVLVVIVLLNVVIAIIDEAWTSAAEKSTRMFWLFRLEKISQLRYAIKVRDNFCASCIYYRTLLMKIDSVENIKYGGDVSWTKPPYHILTMKDHYDNPNTYFNPEDSLKIIEAHSLQADMYWAKMENNKLTFIGRSIILLKWLGLCLLYAILIVLGIPLCGIIWPKQFRAGVLSLGLMNPRNTMELDKTVVSNLTSITSDLTQALAEKSAMLKMANCDIDALKKERRHLVKSKYRKMTSLTQMPVSS